MYARYYDCDPITTKLAKVKDQMLPLLVMDIMGKLPGLPGIFIAGIFSATLRLVNISNLKFIYKILFFIQFFSSLSTGLNSLAAMVLEDFYKPFFTKKLNDKSTQILMKASVVIYGLICFGNILF